MARNTAWPETIRLLKLALFRPGQAHLSGWPGESHSTAHYHFEFGRRSEFGLDDAGG